jgi:hypothetical protein
MNKVTHPPIQAKRELLERLAATQFEIDESTGTQNALGDWIPDPLFHRGVESFRRVIEEELWKLDEEEEAWRALLAKDGEA